MAASRKPSRSGVAHFRANGTKRRSPGKKGRTETHSPTHKTLPSPKTPLGSKSFVKLPFFPHETRNKTTANGRRDNEIIERVKRWLISVESTLHDLDGDTQTAAQPTPSCRSSSPQDTCRKIHNAGMSQLELARFRALCNGTIPAGQFTRFDQERRAARKTTHSGFTQREDKYAHLGKPPPNIVERLYAAVGEQVPEDIRENIRRNSEDNNTRSKQLTANNSPDRHLSRRTWKRLSIRLVHDSDSTALSASTQASKFVLGLPRLITSTTPDSLPTPPTATPRGQTRRGHTYDPWSSTLRSSSSTSSQPTPDKTKVVRRSRQQDDSQSGNTEAQALPPRGLSPIPEEVDQVDDVPEDCPTTTPELSADEEDEDAAESRPSTPESVSDTEPHCFAKQVIPAATMTAVERPRPPHRPVRTASWDALIQRSHARSESMGPPHTSESDARRRAQSKSADISVRGRAYSQPLERPHSIAEESARPRNGRAGSPSRSNAVPSVPIRPRMQIHHPDQRSSQGFAAHVSTLNRNPSPLRTVESTDSLPDFSPRKPFASPLRTVASSDSLPDMKLGEVAPENNSYKIPQAREQKAKNTPSRFSIYGRSRRNTKDGMEELPRPGSFPPALDQMPNNDGHVRAMSWAGTSPMVDEHVPFPSLSRPQSRVSPRQQSPSGWQRRPALIKRQRAGPNEWFQKLPEEVLRLILGYLKTSHLCGKTSCATCWMRDCCSIAMCNKKWLKLTREALYEDIQLVGSDSVQQRKLYKGVYPTRLVLLRRSLRANHQLAQLVRTLKVPALPDEAPIDVEEYHDIVASVIMACPNLERLDGFYPLYNHVESRLVQALTFRDRLKEMTWVVDATPSVSDPPPLPGHKSRPSKSKGQPSKKESAAKEQQYLAKLYSHPNSLLSAPLANAFVRYHTHWKELTHLTVHCLPGSTLRSPHGLLNVVMGYLPSLRHLYLSHVPAESFDDDSLLDMPQPLTKLTLSHCLGISASGLAKFASQSVARELETLTLIHQNVGSLPALVRIFSNLHNLTTFSIVQAMAPVLGDDTSMLLMPYVASQSLRSLHWDILESGIPSERTGEACPTKADDLLARSIVANGFPNLRKLRAPCDPGGLFQMLCKPKERVDLPGDRFRPGVIYNQPTGAASTRYASPAPPYAHSRSQTPKPPSSTHSRSYSGSVSGSMVDLRAMSVYSDGQSSTDSGGKGSVLKPRKAGSDLHRARLVAQARLEAARKLPRIEANIIDEEGIVLESSGLGAYLGDITSKIVYTLAPDVGGTDEHGGLVGITELLGDNGEDLSGTGDKASRSGSGFGTGLVAKEYARSLLEASEDTGPSLSSSPTSGNGKLSKGSKNASKESGLGSEDSGKGCEGCTGRWTQATNDEFAAVVEGNNKKKDAVDRGWHTERGRWRGHVELS